MGERKVDLKEWEGKVIRHVGGDLYLFIGVSMTANDSDEEKESAIYKALYGDCQLHDRKLSEFLSKVDINKYPRSIQEYRFELIDIPSIKNKI